MSATPLVYTAIAQAGVPGSKPMFGMDLKSIPNTDTRSKPVF
jgi:hypothetical protein